MRPSGRCRCLEVRPAHAAPLPPRAFDRAVLTAWPWSQTSTAGVVLPLPRPATAAPVALLALGLNPGRPLDQAQLGFLQSLAGQLATSLSTAALHEQQYAVALALQRSMLPSAVAGSSKLLHVAARDAPSSEDVEVGGDWYDVVPRGAGRTALVIGDVMGRGVHAAAVMGQLRTAVRAYAQLDLPPRASSTCSTGSSSTSVRPATSRADRHVDLRRARLGGRDPDPRQRRPPTRSAVRRRLPHRTRAGRRAAAPGRRAAGQRRSRSRRAGLLLCTDGLIERRDADIDAGIVRLLEAVRLTGTEDLERLADVALGVRGGVQDDDVAILAVRVPHADLPLPCWLELARDPQAARTAGPPRRARCAGGPSTRTPSTPPRCS